MGASSSETIRPGARKQFEIFTEQAKQLTSLAQKVTTDAVQPLQAGVKSTFSKAA
jgi:hypothetical protein